MKHYAVGLDSGTIHIKADLYEQDEMAYIFLRDDRVVATVSAARMAYIVEQDLVSA